MALSLYSYRTQMLPFSPILYDTSRGSIHMVSSLGNVWSKVKLRPQYSPARLMMLSILLLIRMHLYPEPFNGLSGNQWSRYRLCRISMRQSRNFESCDSETFRRPILMRWTRKLLAEINSSFMLDAWMLLNAVANLFQLVCLTQQLVFWRALRR